MLNMVEAGQVGIVIVKDLSRLGRDYLQTGFYTEVVFPEHNVRFIAINDNVDSAAGDNEFAPFKNIINEMLSLRREEMRAALAVGFRKNTAILLLMSAISPFIYLFSYNSRDISIIPANY